MPVMMFLGRVLLRSARAGLIAIFLLCAGPAATAAEPAVAVVTSDGSSAYDEAVAAVIAELARGGLPRSDVTVIAAAELPTRTITLPRLIIALGAQAAQAVSDVDSRTPQLFALLPRTSFEQIIAGRGPSRTVSAIYLDQPFSRQLDLLHLALPEAKRIGVLFGPGSRHVAPFLQRAIAERGLTMTSATLERSETLYPLLQQVLGNADVLLALADPLVFNGNTIQNILLASLHARVPLVAFSPAYVKAGALLALYSTPTQIGTQAGALALAALQGRGLPTPQYPAAYTVGVNQHVARALGLNLDEASLSKQLQQMEHTP
jgi:putative ABC transport system substrate-binding protein